MDMVTITRGQYERDIAEAKAAALREVAERLSRANDNILTVRETHWEESERARLLGKAEGVRLAISYVDEIGAER